jgi:phosphoglycolate phosphatase-like HAD superfamily hydrolase
MRRLILFDVDGTLVWGGPAKDAFHRALMETFGTAGDIEVHSFAGKTDPQIARELLTGAGLSAAAIDAGFAELWERYLGYLAELLESRPVSVLPGVPLLLQELARRTDVGLGLLTGNIVGGAELKLRSAGLFEHFGVGSYGSDHEERDELAGIALARASERWSVTFDPRDVFIVGDTPRDVQCGRAGGTRTLGVATGHYGVEDLERCGADHVLVDLTDTGRVVALLAG